MAKYRLRFFYDWGSGVLLWAVNDAAKEKFGDYPVMTQQLEISKDLIDELERLRVLHDEAMNFDEPNGELLWDEKQIAEFCRMSEHAYKRLCEELGEGYEVEYRGGF